MSQSLIKLTEIETSWGMALQWPKSRLIHSISKGSKGIIMEWRVYPKPATNFLSWKCFLAFYIWCIYSSALQTRFFMEVNNMDPGQTAPKGAVWSGSILFAILATLEYKEMRGFVWFDSLYPSQQFFSYVRTGLPRLNQYLAGTILSQGHNPVPLLRLKPTTFRFQVKHSTTEPLCSRRWEEQTTKVVTGELIYIWANQWTGTNCKVIPKRCILCSGWIFCFNILESNQSLHCSTFARSQTWVS